MQNINCINTNQLQTCIAITTIHITVVIAYKITMTTRDNHDTYDNTVNAAQITPKEIIITYSIIMLYHYQDNIIFTTKTAATATTSSTANNTASAARTSKTHTNNKA